MDLIPVEPRLEAKTEQAETEESPANSRTAVISDVGENTKASVKETKDTRDNSPLFVVEIKDYSKTGYPEWKKKATSLGGYWSRFTKGFNFSTKAKAEEFNAWMNTEAKFSKSPQTQNSHTTQSLLAAFKAQLDKTFGEGWVDRLFATNFLGDIF